MNFLRLLHKLAGLFHFIKSGIFAKQEKRIWTMH